MKIRFFFRDTKSVKRKKVSYSKSKTGKTYRRVSIFNERIATGKNVPYNPRKKQYAFASVTEGEIVKEPSPDYFHKIIPIPLTRFYGKKPEKALLIGYLRDQTDLAMEDYIEQAQRLKKKKYVIAPTRETDSKGRTVVKHTREKIKQEYKTDYVAVDRQIYGKPIEVDVTENNRNSEKRVKTYEFQVDSLKHSHFFEVMKHTDIDNLNDVTMYNKLVLSVWLKYNDNSKPIYFTFDYFDAIFHRDKTWYVETELARKGQRLDENGKVVNISPNDKEHAHRLLKGLSDTGEKRLNPNDMTSIQYMLWERLRQELQAQHFTISDDSFMSEEDLEDPSLKRLRGYKVLVKAECYYDREKKFADKYMSKVVKYARKERVKREQAKIEQAKKQERAVEKQQRLASAPAKKTRRVQPRQIKYKNPR